MRGIEDKQAFKDAKKIFINSFTDKTKCEDEEKCSWSVFKDAFLSFSKNKCPICEDSLNKYDDIDHYRPKKAGYDFLRCCCDNYMIMCSDCNRTHKYTSFPLYSGFKASCRDDLIDEKPLLVNPREDNIYEYFDLYFVKTTKGKLLLELKARLGLNTYENKKAEMTIDIYGIGNCENNSKVDSCRLEILENHYDDFIELAEAKNKDNDEEFEKILNSRRMRKKKESGFVKFIKLKQFKLLDTI